MDVNAILPLLLGLQSGNKPDLTEMMLKMLSSGVGDNPTDYFLNRRNDSEPVFPTGGTRSGAPDSMMMLLLSMMMQQNGKTAQKESINNKQENQETINNRRENDTPLSDKKSEKQEISIQEKSAQFFSDIENISGAEVAESLKILTENQLP